MTASSASDARVRALLEERSSLRRTAALLMGAPGPVWSGARIAVFDADVNPRVARDWLPPGLRPATPARATVFVADYPETTFGVAYREAGVLLHARRWGRPVLHCAWMVVDDDTALILGRELLGFPKKLARIDFSFDDGGASARVRRRGAELIALRIDGAVELSDRLPFAHPIVNLRGIPGVLPGVLMRMDVPQRVHRGRRGAMAIEIGGGVHDPLDRLEIGKGDVEGHLLVADLAFPPDGRRGIPRGVGPVGWVAPTWLVSHYPERVW